MKREDVKSVLFNENAQEECLELILSVTDSVYEKALDLISARINEIYFPGPVCGGDISRDEGYGWASFDDFNLAAFPAGKWYSFGLQREIEFSEQSIMITIPLPDEDDFPLAWVEFAGILKKLFN